MTKIHFDDKRDKKIILYILDNALDVLNHFFKGDEDNDTWQSQRNIIKDI